MRMRSPIPKKHARIEIIPLIDIMFFLLASFMMVSLSQTHMKGIRVTLPAQGQTPPNQPKDYLSIRVSPGNEVFFDNQLVDNSEVLPRLMQMEKANPNIKVSISGELLTPHGYIIDILDKVRLAQITKVGYQIRAAPSTSH